MKQALLAGLIGAVIGGLISATIGYLAPLPTTAVHSALASGAAGFISAFFAGFMAIKTQRSIR